MTLGSQLGGIADELEEFVDKIKINYQTDDNEEESGKSNGIEMILEEQDRPSYVQRISKNKILQGMNSSEIKKKKNDLLGGMNLEDLMTRRPTCKQGKGAKSTKFEFENGEDLDIPEESEEDQKMDLLESENLRLKSFDHKRIDMLPKKSQSIKKKENQEYVESLENLEKKFTRPTQMSVEKRTPRKSREIEQARRIEIDESQMTRQINRGEEAKLKSHDITKNSPLRIFQTGPMTPIRRPDIKLLEPSTERSPVNPIYGKEVIKRYSRSISPIRKSGNQNFEKNGHNFEFRAQDGKVMKPSTSKSSQLVAKSVDYNLGRVPGKGHIYRRFVLSGDRPDAASFSPNHKNRNNFKRPLNIMSQPNFDNLGRGFYGRDNNNQSMSHRGLIPLTARLDNKRNFRNLMYHQAETRSMPGSPIQYGRSRFSPLNSQGNHKLPDPQNRRFNLSESYYLPRGMVRQTSEMLHKGRLWSSPSNNLTHRMRNNQTPNLTNPQNFRHNRPKSPLRTHNNNQRYNNNFNNHNASNKNNNNIPQMYNRGVLKPTKYSHRKQPNNQLPIRNINLQKNRRARQLPQFNPEAMAQLTRQPRPHSTMSVHLQPKTPSRFSPNHILSEIDLAHKLTNLFKKTLVYSSKIESLKKKILRQNPRFLAEPIFLVFASFPEHLSAEDLFMLFRAFKLKLAPLAVGKIMLYMTGYKAAKLLQGPQNLQIRRKKKTKQYSISPNGRLISQKETMTESEHFHAQNSRKDHFQILNRSEEPGNLHHEQNLILNNFGEGKRYLTFSDFRLLLESEREEEREPQSNFNLTEDLYIKEIDYHIIRQILILLTRKIKDMGSIIRGLRPYGSQKIFEFLQSYSGPLNLRKPERTHFEDSHDFIKPSKKSKKPYLQNLEPNYFPNEKNHPKSSNWEYTQNPQKKERKMKARMQSRKERDFYIQAEEEPADDEDFEPNSHSTENPPTESYYLKADRQITDPRNLIKEKNMARDRFEIQRNSRPYVENQILDDDMVLDYQGEATETVLTLLSFERFLDEREIQFVSEDLRLVMRSFGSQQEWLDFESLENFILSPVWDL